MKISPLMNHVGIRISGIDQNQNPVSDRVLAGQLRELWDRHGLILFDQCKVSDEMQISLSQCFGDLEIHPLQAIRHADHQELIVLTSKDKVRSPMGYYDEQPRVGKLPWHKDLIYTPKPNRGALLKAVVMPGEDGETGFGDLALAFRELPEHLKQRIEGLEIRYRFGVDLSQMEFLRKYKFKPGEHSPRSTDDVGFPDFPDVIYPLLLDHPVTGDRILNISPMFLDSIVGMEADASRELLWQLVDHICEPRFHYVHSWSEGEMILWDNWRFMHCALGHAPGQHRKIHRTTIVGDRALGRVA